MDFPSRENLAAGDISGRKTWRLLFRILTLSIGVVCLAINIATIAKLDHLDNMASNTWTTTEADRVISSITTPLKVPVNQINDMFRIVALDLPLQMTSLQKETASQVGFLAESINNVLSKNGSAGLVLVNDPEYAGGIAVSLYQGDASAGLNFQPISLIEHPSFVPGPTTAKGCIRIPTFHMGPSHWCYSHNIIASGCQDASHSSMYISLGVLKASQTGSPIFLTTASQLVDDNINRKSCSIVASKYGCDILCSIVIETEDEDYRSDPATSMIIGRLFFNGSYTESKINTGSIFSLFSANYPAVGSGIVVGDEAAFPIYGGVKQNTWLFNQLKDFGYFTHNDVYKCNRTDIQQTILDAYRPPKISGRLWVQGILLCPVSLRPDPGCRLKVFNTSNVMMGAEARLIQVGSTVYLYQRSSSWWVVGLTYKLDVSEITSQTGNTLNHVDPIAHTKFPRPSFGRDACARPNICPAVCVSGVYQDIWPISTATNNSNIVWVGQYLEAFYSRKYPRIGIATQYEWKVTNQLFNSNTEGGYSTTTCFRNTKRDKAYCVVISEYADGVFGSYRIVPQLIEIRTTTGKSE
uniref:Hemagglutinin-neuraminidase n=1 Tax=avian paramyxovirus 2 TaxID=2560313 RepID=A0A1Q2TSN3_9MONO|nr:hemagglutinin-neuraminidase protein [Avian metaavulavirus 2]BAW94633.1 hemagglutinin-neuraminidase protein [Avian metaavulavirus 2]